MRSASFGTLATILLTCGQASATIRYVNDDAPPGGNGLSWATAHQRLDTALAAAIPGDQIWVAVGRYEPTTPNGSRALSFVLKSGVPLYGGFRGNENSLSQRAGLFEDTLLSGDLNRDNVVLSNSDENSYNVVKIQHDACVLDGFNIAYGNADGTGFYQSNGGGIVISGSGSIVRNCILQLNQCSGSSAGGGAAYVGGASTTLENCTFLSNRSTGSSGGGALIAFGDLALRGCRFQFNEAFGASFGGGAVSSVFAELVVEHCLFQSNRVDSDSSGGGAAIRAGSPRIYNSTFFANRAEGGSGSAITAEQVEMANCVVATNTTLTGSGAVILFNGASSISNCTFANNSAPMSSSGGGIVMLGGTVSVANSILYFNSNATGSSQAAQVNSFGGGVSMNYSCVQGLTGSLGGVGNIADNPRFILPSGMDRIGGTPDDDYRIRLDSACIDAGSNGLLPADVSDLDDDADTAEPLPVDLAGGDRRSDDPFSVDSGSGFSPLVDMGAFEFRSPTIACPADFDGSGFVDTEDFDAFVRAFEAGC